MFRLPNTGLGLNYMKRMPSISAQIVTPALLLLAMPATMASASPIVTLQPPSTTSLPATGGVVTVTVSVSDAASTVSNVTATLVEDGDVVQTKVFQYPDTKYICSFKIRGNAHLYKSMYVVHVTATDAAGSVSSPARSVPIIELPDTLPAISHYGFIVAHQLPNDIRYNYRGVITDTSSGLAAYARDQFVTGGPNTSSSNQGFDTYHPFTESEFDLNDYGYNSFASGFIDLAYIFQDGNGNNSTFYIHLGSIVRIGPNVSNVSLSLQNAADGGTFSLSATATDNTPVFTSLGLKSVHAVLFRNGVNYPGGNQEMTSTGGDTYTTQFHLPANLSGPASWSAVVEAEDSVSTEVIGTWSNKAMDTSNVVTQ